MCVCVCVWFFQLPFSTLHYNVTLHALQLNIHKTHEIFSFTFDCYWFPLTVLDFSLTPKVFIVYSSLIPSGGLRRWLFSMIFLILRSTMEPFSLFSALYVWISGKLCNVLLLQMEDRPVLDLLCYIHVRSTCRWNTSFSLFASVLLVQWNVELQLVARLVSISCSPPG